MASPDVADALTRQYRAGQQRISRRLLAELLRLWRAIVDPDDFSTFQTFAEVAAGLVGQSRAQAADAAARFYEMFRATQVVPAAALLLAGEAAAEVMPFTPVRADLLDESAVAGLLQGAAISGFTNGRRAGQTVPRALDNGFVKVAGASTRLALNGGRETVVASTRADEEAVGWTRVTDGDPCAFCLVLASRGPEYKSRRTAGFRAHDHCSCVPRPAFPGTPLPESVRRFEEIYTAAQAWARANGVSDPSQKNYAIKNVRAYLSRDS